MERGIRAYCKKPPLRKTITRYLEGGCPELLYDLLGELEGASQIHIAAYLFNNPIYAEFIKGLVDRGCRVNIVSIPIRGYSDKQLKVQDYQNKVSGRDMAESVYNDLDSIHGIELRIFPHMYIWYGALYADGGASYSFHVKAILAEFPDQPAKSILSSGNFMFTDPPHSDNFIVIQGYPEYSSVFRRFFDDVMSYAIPFSEYEESYTTAEDDFRYGFLGREVDLPRRSVENCFFTAPFYTVDGVGSNHYAGNRIIEVIRTAQRRIWVCAQHFHDLVSFDTERETIVKAIYEVYGRNPDIEMRFLKQVPHSSLADKRRAAIAETLFQYVMGAQQRFNRLVHEKFILVDNTLILTTANYTSTQFAFALRRMEMKFENGKLRKNDYFSEVNGFIILPDCGDEVLRQYEEHFNELWDEGTDIQINL